SGFPVRVIMRYHPCQTTSGKFLTRAIRTWTILVPLISIGLGAAPRLAADNPATRTHGRILALDCMTVMEP
ncbi:MAG TPA: hypothetical protein VJK31_04345, partial [Chthoniobacterales bacterium]|nr:hypothetical protein [Chthoniobacterales bacterium]